MRKFALRFISPLFSLYQIMYIFSIKFIYLFILLFEIQGKNRKKYPNIFPSTLSIPNQEGTDFHFKK